MEPAGNLPSGWLVSTEIRRGLETLLYEQFITLQLQNLAAETAFMHLGNEVLLDSRRKLLCVGKRWKACHKARRETVLISFYQVLTTYAFVLLQALGMRQPRASAQLVHAERRFDCLCERNHGSVQV